MYCPSVTQTLNIWANFDHVPEDVLQAAADRGTLVHEICTRLALGIPYFPLTNAHRAVQGYIDSFRRWQDKVVQDVLMVQRRLVDPAYAYHGELDLLVQAKHGEILLVDLKSPVAKSKTWRLQLAAYDRLLQSVEGIKADRIGSLRLDCDGKTPKMDYYERSNNDLAVFLSALNVHRFFNS
jgi:hypothetical protein